MAKIPEILPNDGISEGFVSLRQIDEMFRYVFEGLIDGKFDFVRMAME